mmetsp:Transcript_27410/g.80661  ORF Transcript_27410/g.80661 Transcript_27410/m.80661 type:complete len:208 (-) Transcript_27410:320-943(-)
MMFGVRLGASGAECRQSGSSSGARGTTPRSAPLSSTWRTAARMAPTADSPSQPGPRTRWVHGIRLARSACSTCLSRPHSGSLAKSTPPVSESPGGSEAGLERGCNVRECSAKGGPPPQAPCSVPKSTDRGRSESHSELSPVIAEAPPRSTARIASTRRRASEEVIAPVFARVTSSTEEGPFPSSGTTSRKGEPSAPRGRLCSRRVEP